MFKRHVVTETVVSGFTTKEAMEAIEYITTPGNATLPIVIEIAMHKTTLFSIPMRIAVSSKTLKPKQ